MGNYTKQVVYSQQHNTLDELKVAAEKEWGDMSITTLRNLMLSIPRRLEKVLKLNGAYTGYLKTVLIAQAVWLYGWLN